MRQQIECQLDHENVELTLSRSSQLFESWLLFYIERIISLMETIVFNSIQVTNYWFILHCALRPLYQQAQTSSPNIQGISDQDVTCKCHMSMYLGADSSQSPHSLQCICCHPCLCKCWCWFSSLCWSAAAHSVHSLFSDKGHHCAARCEHSVYTATYHTELSENSSFIIHQCNSDSESECVDFCWLYQLSDTWYDTLFEMLLYIRTFQWVLQ